MKRFGILIALFATAAVCVSLSEASDQAVFGPKKYDVKERYGKPNKYADAFAAREGFYLFKLQNGDKLQEQSEWIELVVNGEKILRDGRYGHRYFGGFLNLRNDNKVEIMLKDDIPSGLRRPALPPRFVTVTVAPAPAAMNKMKGIFGLAVWDDLEKFTEAVLTIRNPEAQAVAMASVNLQNDVAARAEAMRKLANHQDSSAQTFLFGVYRDLQCVPDVRGEAAVALGMLGDTAVIPTLMPGILDPEEKVRLGSARALSFFKEQDTRELLQRTLEKLDTMRKDATIKAIASAGWKPAETILKLAESSDAQVASTATRLLGSMQDRRATDLLLKFLAEPGPRDEKIIIASLGDSKDPRAVEPLLTMAKDGEKRQGKQAELGEALAELGDQRAADVIADMIRKADNRNTWDRLRAAYKKLMGKDFGK